MLAWFLCVTLFRAFMKVRSLTELTEVRSLSVAILAQAGQSFSAPFAVRPPATVHCALQIRVDFRYLYTLKAFSVDLLPSVV